MVATVTLRVAYYLHSQVNQRKMSAVPTTTLWFHRDHASGVKSSYGSGSCMLAVSSNSIFVFDTDHVDSKVRIIQKEKETLTETMKRSSDERHTSTHGNN